MTWLEPIGARIIPANFGPMRGFTTHARIEGSCGDTMEFWLRLEDVTLLQASFTSDGCETSVACGSAAAYLSQGKTLSEMRKVRPIDVLDLIGLEDDEEAHHCADLAVRTLARALDGYEHARERGGGSMSRPVVQLKALGLIRTPHQDPDQTPIQPCFAGGIQGEILLDPACREGLEGLEGFSHAFLLYHLHKAEPGAMRVKPFLVDEPKGVFACRFPHRPNGLGMSLVKLLAIEGCRVTFEGADMLDGTPLLDIKPYYPKADAPEAAWGGWTEQVDPDTAWQIGSRRTATPQGVRLVPGGTYFRNDRLPSLPLD